MNYQKIYNQLIEKAKNRTSGGYTELHHIIPRCMGGSDDKENLVALYPEEHFVAHALLLKIYKDTEYRFSLAKAVHKMTVGHKGRRVDRKLYGWLQREHALAMSESQKGEGNSQYGSRWICHLDLKENRKIGKNEPLPEGWILGRNRWIKHRCKCGEELSKARVLQCQKCYRQNRRYKISEEMVQDAIRETDGSITSIARYCKISSPRTNSFQRARIKEIIRAIG